MPSREINIAGTKILAGENKVIDLNIARLPSGTQIDLPIYVFRSPIPGPIVLLSAGLHGDEVNGVEIVRRLIAQGTLKELICGTVIGIPIMNIYGFLNFSREVPDGKDVNRSFPGNKNGSLASVVAYNLTNIILKQVDFGIDFHTGGASRYNYPQVRYAIDDSKAAEIAKAFNAPITLISKLVDKSIRKQCALFGKSLIVYEAGETLRFDEFSIKMGIRGAKNVLHHFKMIKEPRIKEQESIFCEASLWWRAKKAGLFTAYVKSGDIVEPKQDIGKITDPFGKYESKVKAPARGIIVGHNNMPVVHRGDALFHIGKMSE